MIWNKEMECADRETMRALQLEKLKKTVKYEYDNVPYYRKKMDDAGVKPGPLLGKIIKKLTVQVVNGELPNDRETLINEAEKIKKEG